MPQTDFEAQVVPLSDWLRRVAGRAAKCAADADDLAQEAMLRAFRNFHRFKPGTHLKSWLLVVLRNIHINRWRHARRAQRSFESCKNDCDGRLSRVFDADLRRLKEEIDGALAQMPAPQRRIWVLADRFDFSYREIAEQESVPIGTVMSRLCRVRQNLGGQILLRRRAAAAREILEATPRIETVIRKSVVFFDFAGARAHYTAGDLAVKTLPLRDFPPRDELRGGPTRYVENLASRSSRSRVWKWLLSLGVRSCVTAPVVLNRKLLGAFNLGASGAGAFTSEHRDMARAMADRLGSILSETS